MNMKTIKLTSNEIWPLLNILNEVCHGIHINNFEQAIGNNKKFVVDLMERISNEENEIEPVLILNKIELEVIIMAFEEVFKQIEEWEFQTRIGITKPEAIDIQKKIIL